MSFANSDGILVKDVITGSSIVGPLEEMALSDLIDEIYAGNTYAKIHTTENRGGEIRGQIMGNMPGGKN